MRKKFTVLTKRLTAVGLSLALTLGLIPIPFDNSGGSDSGTVKKAEAAALTFQTGDGSALKPVFNSANFPTFDQNSGNTEYYFGKTGNAFYGVGTNGTDSNGDTCGFTSNTTWELVDTDSSMNGTTLSSAWGSSSSSSSGQKILDYTNGLTNTYFSAADQKAMKSKSVAIDTYHWSSSYSGTGTGSINNAKLWPLSVKQMMQSGVTPSNDTYKQVTNLEKKLYSNTGGYVWSRSLYCCYSDYYAWELDSGYVGDSNVANSFRVAPAFNLDLEEVLIARSASSGVSQTPLSSASVASGNLKFLINAGTEKSNFNIAAISGKKLTNVYNGKTYQFDYSGASTSQLNGGTNYVSAIIYDSTGKVVYYGNLGTINSASGTAQITIPSLTVGQNYTLALFQEEKCASQKTDYASTPVYASFTAKNKMSLSYDASTNGGTTSASNISEIEPGTVYNSSSPALTQTASKEGWEFVGWNTDKDAHEALTSLTMDSDKTLYAIFKKDLTVTFIDAGS